MIPSGDVQFAIWPEINIAAVMPQPGVRVVLPELHLAAGQGGVAASGEAGDAVTQRAVGSVEDVVVAVAGEVGIEYQPYQAAFPLIGVDVGDLVEWGGVYL